MCYPLNKRIEEIYFCILVKAGNCGKELTSVVSYRVQQMNHNTAWAKRVSIHKGWSGGYKSPLRSQSNIERVSRSKSKSTFGQKMLQLRLLVCVLCLVVGAMSHNPRPYWTEGYIEAVPTQDFTTQNMSMAEEIFSKMDYDIR